MSNMQVASKIIISVFIAGFIQFSAFANQHLLSSEQFIEQAFSGNTSTKKVLWLNKEDKVTIADIMNHSFNLLRVRYWQYQQETVWILNEIGKEKPITVGVHIKENQIMSLKVLTFRESRGDEVKHDFFTRQFDGARLVEENNLNQHIDGITGATMSVRALTKVAKLSLWLNKKALLDK